MNRQLDALKRRTHEAVLLERARCNVFLRDLSPAIDGRENGKTANEFGEDSRRRLCEDLERFGWTLSEHERKLLLLDPDSDFGE